MRAAINGAELCVDTFGEPRDPAVLLVMGAAGSMDRWEEPFCERLAAAGRYVIRYDQRDTGSSTTYPPGKPGYTSDDLIADAIGVLDHLGVERAHFVGISMGGGLVQRIAVDHPERVLSLTLMSTSPAGTGGPDLPPMSDELRALLGRVYDRSTSLPSANNHFMLEGTERAHARLAEITAPALVIHGTEDPLFPTAHGEALARDIPGAKLLTIEGLGHELPPWAWDEVLPALIAVTGE